VAVVEDHIGRGGGDADGDGSGEAGNSQAVEGLVGGTSLETGGRR